MKKLLPLVILFVFVGLKAQITLTYDNHCYQENAEYWYQLVQYAEPGDAGDHCVWNFSALKEVELMDGEINTESYAVRNDLFPESSVAITEYGNTFIYKKSVSQISQIGYVAKNSDAYVRYTKPFVKLKFPFTYKNSYTGEVEMLYENGNYTKKGVYNVNADAYGLIILPNNKSYRNALRVHTRTTYNLGDNNAQVLDIYRWYVAEERFPVMVIQDVSYVQSSGKVVHNYKAAYNKSSLKSATLDYQAFFKISPNPASTYIDLTFDLKSDSKVSVDVYGLDGRFVQNYFSGNKTQGAQYFHFPINKSVLASGVYVLKVTTDSEVLTEQFIVKD